MLVVQADFVAAFPEFGNATLYTPAQYGLWEAEAERELDPCTFGDSLPLAVMLFVAHNLSLSGMATALAAVPGSVAGRSLAAVSSKTVGSVSVSYDTADSSIAGAGEWNSTSYGQRLYRMLKSFNTGPRYTPHPYPLPMAGRRLGFGRRY